MDAAVRAALTPEQMMRCMSGLVASLLWLASACAPTRPVMAILNEREVNECEAAGGSVEPAYALHQYVCLLDEKRAPAPEVH